MKKYSKKVIQLIKRASQKHSVSPIAIESGLMPKNADLMKNRRHQFFFKKFNPKPGDIILDVGSHTGAYLYALSQEYPQCKFIGYDIIPEYVDLANEVHGSDNCKFICQDIFKADIKPGSIKYIIFFEVLEHVDNPKDFISLFYKFLKKDGKLLLSTPSALGITNVLLNIKNRSLKYIEQEERNTGTEKDHIYIWDKLTLFRLLNRCGFKYDSLYVSQKFLVRRGQSLCFILKK